MNIQCPKHGEVKFTGTGDFIGDETPVTMYCPACVEEETTNIPKDILEREKTNQLRLHTYAEVWLGAIKR